MFLLGHWKNFEELEENLSLPELTQVLDASRKAQKEQNTFLAAIQGIDLDKGNKTTPDFEEVKRRAQAKLAGVTEEEIDLAAIGIKIEVEDE